MVGDNDDDDDDEVTCPLFMEGLPKDFASNPQLAAIASLLNDSDHEEEPPKKSILLQPQQVVGKRGGGKIRVRKHQPQATTPYQLPKRKPKTSAIGEAHLFLSMWKL